MYNNLASEERKNNAVVLVMLGTFGVTGCEAMSVQDPFFQVDSDSQFCSHWNTDFFTLPNVLDPGSWIRL